MLARLNRSRVRRVAALIAASCSLAMLAPLACVSNDTATPPGAADSGTPPISTPDGSVLPANDSGPGPTPAADGAIDSSDAATATGTTVTVKVVNVFGPESGIEVVFGDATGAVVASQTTDATAPWTQTVSPEVR